MVRAVGAFAAILAVAASLWYVTAPPKGLDGYRARAAYTAGTLRSQVQSARLTADAVTDDKLPHAAALVGFEEAESDAASAASGFETFEPPVGAGRVGARFVSLASETTDALAALRISAQQERWDRIRSLAEPLPGLAARLDDLIGRLEP